MRSETVAMQPVIRREIDAERAGVDWRALGLLREVPE